MLCSIWYYLYNLKNVKNTHGGVLLLVKLQASVVFNASVISTHCDIRQSSRHLNPGIQPSNRNDFLAFYITSMYFFNRSCVREG